MDRREALTGLTILFGGTIIGSEVFLSGCTNKNGIADGQLITASDINLLDEIGEVILPATANSPGAKDAQIGQFMKVIVTDCYSPEEQEIFINGLKLINKISDEKYGKDFLELDKQERHDLFMSFENSPEVIDDQKHYYHMYKQLTIWGFLTSEPGATKALRHVDVPGRYDACIPLEKGGKAWAGV